MRLAPGRTRYRGLETLAAALTARRALLHDAFVKQWQQVKTRACERLEAELDKADPPRAALDGSRTRGAASSCEATHFA